MSDTINLKDLQDFLRKQEYQAMQDIIMEDIISDSHYNYTKPITARTARDVKNHRKPIIRETLENAAILDIIEIISKEIPLVNLELECIANYIVKKTKSLIKERIQKNLSLRQGKASLDLISDIDIRYIAQINFVVNLIPNFQKQEKDFQKQEKGE